MLMSSVLDFRATLTPNITSTTSFDQTFGPNFLAGKLLCINRRLFSQVSEQTSIFKRFMTEK